MKDYFFRLYPYAIAICTGNTEQEAKENFMKYDKRKDTHIIEKTVFCRDIQDKKQELIKLSEKYGVYK